MRLCAWLCVGAALTCVGCAGVRDETPAELEPAASPLLDDKRVLVGGGICDQGASVETAPLSAATALGFSGADVLAFARGSHQTSVHWSDGLAPESGEHALKVVIEPRASTVRVIDPAAGVIGHGLICETWIEIDVTVTLQSDRGALNERFEATLYTRASDVAYLHVIGAGTRLGGALQLGSQSAAAEHHYALQLRVAKSGVSGDLVGVTQPRSSEFHQPPAVRRELAFFGPAHCGVDGNPFELDTDLNGVSGRALVDRITALPPFRIAWNDGSETQASLHFTPDNGACTYGEGPLQDPRLSVQGQLGIRSDDGRVIGDYESVLSVMLAASRSAEVSFFVDRIARPQGETITPEQIGFPKQSRAGFEALDLLLNLTLDAQNVMMGRIELVGYRSDDTPETLELGELR